MCCERIFVRVLNVRQECSGLRNFQLTSMASQFSSLCISLLTELLDLNSLESLLDEERESHVVRNIRTELGDDAALKVDILTDVGVASCGGHTEKKEKKFHKRLIKSTSKGMKVAD